MRPGAAIAPNDFLFASLLHIRDDIEEWLNAEEHIICKLNYQVNRNLKEQFTLACIPLIVIIFQEPFKIRDVKFNFHGKKSFFNH